uniref:BAP29/BAP31 transmembrane domain-containing protein n=1 Tax=Lotharella oceanica TaxID=641309 RepID=A0A7S2X8Y1_9EUKA|mmetsp:Transcript_2093/g.4018  ORF Transcript_2093/g.4018 Transcript_2093/m.4018 type:complete len:131 (+) Transcript_2093:67-459(+)|eukprot:CAMPEP_0170167696 /NCGR_PEP_ID=MMETSP0040_2-20121228/1029_1 /TAXON_ID=641309 /ORGANISM="Lotharella oceanica, Strain CCMP622" /LENGTH=130 /DNA_ID=CAMNT_0010405803 /DNA_START=47 /DNA_END=439 /DNA_ORIENTATION=+
MAGLNTLMLYFMLTEAVLILVLLIPIRFLTRGPVKLMRWLVSGSPRQYTYGSLLVFFIVVIFNLYSALNRYRGMKLTRQQTGEAARADIFYKAQRDAYLNGITLYLYVVLVLLLWMHERNEAREQEHRRR